VRLSQIVTLRTLGFDLAAIKAILDAPDFDLRTALRAQILLLEERRNLLDVAIGTLRNVEQQADTETPTWGTLAPTIEAMLAVQKIDFSKHYTPEQLAALRARKLQPEEQANISARWNQLFRDIDAASGDDPASDRAQALLDQWDALIAFIADGATAIAVAQIIVISVPWASIDAAWASLGDIGDVVIVDTTNPFAADGIVELPTTSAAFNARRFGVRPYAKAFNTLTSGFQAAAIDRASAHRAAMFCAASDQRAADAVEPLIVSVGFVPIFVGGPAESALMEAFSMVWPARHRVPRSRREIGSARPPFPGGTRALSRIPNRRSTCHCQTLKPQLQLSGREDGFPARWTDRTTRSVSASCAASCTR